MKKSKGKGGMQRDYFRDAVQIFLDYIDRKLKEDSKYDPHPIIKAFEIAFSQVLKAKNDKPVMAVSGRDGRQPTCVILKKSNGKIILEKIIDMTTGNEIHTDFLIRIFRLQIKLDGEGANIKTERIAEILNEIFPEFHFHALGNKWPEARDQFIKDMKAGKVVLPREGSEQLTKDLLSIRTNTPWEDYPSSVRGLVAASAYSFFDQRNATIILSTPPTLANDKNKIFEIIYRQYLGAEGKYFGMNNCKFCEPDEEFKKSIISISDYFILLADRYPIQKGHLLIASKIHVRSMGDLPLVQLYELEELIEAAFFFYRTVGHQDYSFIEGGFHYQGVYHAHMHLLPRFVAPEKEFPGIIRNVKNVSSWEEIVEFYKKQGSYILWKNRDGMFISQADPKIEEYKNKSISEILGSKWKKEKGNTSFDKETRKLQLETLKEWEEYRVKRKKAAASE